LLFVQHGTNEGMPQDGQLSLLHVPVGPPSPPEADLQVLPLLVNPEKQSKSHVPFVHFKKPFDGAAFGHLVQSPSPQPMFGVGKVQTPPQTFCPAWHIGAASVSAGVPPAPLDPLVPPVPAVAGAPPVGEPPEVPPVGAPPLSATEVPPVETVPPLDTAPPEPSLPAPPLLPETGVEPPDAPEASFKVNGVTVPWMSSPFAQAVKHKNPQTIDDLELIMLVQTHSRRPPETLHHRGRGCPAQRRAENWGAEVGHARTSVRCGQGWLKRRPRTW
jgi:hypothetical protein